MVDPPRPRIQAGISNRLHMHHLFYLYSLNRMAGAGNSGGKRSDEFNNAGFHTTRAAPFGISSGKVLDEGGGKWTLKAVLRHLFPYVADLHWNSALVAGLAGYIWGSPVHQCRTWVVTGIKKVLCLLGCAVQVGLIFILLLTCNVVCLE